MSYMRPLDRRPRIQWRYTDTMELERQIAEKQQVRPHRLSPPSCNEAKTATKDALEIPYILHDNNGIYD